MKRQLGFAIGRLLPLLFCLLAFAARADDGKPATSQAQPDDVAATVVLIEGDVRVADKNSVARSLHVGSTLSEGDSITTGTNGELHLRMADTGYIAVRPNTRMQIINFRARGDDDDKSIIGLLSGSFRAVSGWIGKFNRKNDLVRTSTGTIGVRGTDHEPLVIPEGGEGEPGTYDKVNIGGTYIETQQGRVDVPEGRAAYVSRAGRVAPRLLERVPGFFRPTRHEGLLLHEHERVQRALVLKREERRKTLLRRGRFGQRAAGMRRVDHSDAQPHARAVAAGGMRPAMHSESQATRERQTERQTMRSQRPKRVESESRPQGPLARQAGEGRRGALAREAGERRRERRAATSEDEEKRSQRRRRRD